MRRVSLKVRPSDVEGFVSVFKNEVIPRTKKMAGVRRLYLLRSADSPNDFVALTFWDSKEDADGYQNSEAYSSNGQDLRPLLEADPILNQFHIEVHEVNSDSLEPPEKAVQKAEEEVGGTEKATRRTARKSAPKRARSRKAKMSSKKRSATRR